MRSIGAMRVDEVLEQLGMHPELVAWSSSRTGLLQLWEECPRGDWLLALATRVGVDRRLVVAAAGDCAQMAQCFIPRTDTRPAMALAMAQKWTEDEATGAPCWAAGFRAAGAATEAASWDEAISDAAMAAACVAFASDGAADDLYYASRAHAAEAALLAARAYRRTRVNAHRVCAEFVRYRMPVSEVTRRLETALRSSMPPPPPEPGRPGSDLHPRLWFDPEYVTS